MSELSLNTNVGITGCFTIHLGGLLQKIDNSFYEETEDKIKIKTSGLPLLGGLIYKQLEDSFKNCLGKELEIEFGDTATANSIESVVQIIVKYMVEQAEKNETTNAGISQ